MRDVMNKIVGIIGLKGGSGKTTLGVNLSAGLAIRGKKVLLIDIAPVGTEIKRLIPEYVKLTCDIESVCTGIPLKKAIYQSTIQGVDIVPYLNKNPDIVDHPNLRSQLFNEPDKNPLKKALNSTAIKDYDYVIIDNFELFGTMTKNLLPVADTLIAPVSDHFGMEKLEKANEILNVDGVKNFELCIDSIVMTKVMSNTVLFKKRRKELVEVFGDKVCRTNMPETIKFDEAMYHKKSVYDYGPKSYAAIQCMKLVDELLERWENT